MEANRQELHVLEPETQSGEVSESDAQEVLPGDEEVDPSSQSVEPAAAPDLLDVLSRLGELHAAWFLTEAEFEAKKKSILERL